ncbi:MAG: carbamoyltransferase [bacterium]|nr:carbamoyltransferase [bacterium]
MNILGISAYYHDSAACLVQDGSITAAAQEERFTRRKHDSGFPLNAVRYCLAAGDVGEGQVDVVVFYDKPLTKFSRILKTSFAVAPRGLDAYLMAIPLWLREKLWIPADIEQALATAGAGKPGKLCFTEHHESHAAGAFFPGPFESAAVLTLDGVGEWATSSLSRGEGNRLTMLEELHFPHSLGLLYSAFTYHTGFRVNSGEYKLMGLAPYGRPVYAERIREHLVDIRSDGSFRLNMDYFGFADSLTMTNDRFSTMFDGPPRAPESDLTQREMDLARSVQVVVEEIVLLQAQYAARVTGEKRLCLAGGVALNCVANGRLLRESPFEEIWIQPAAGDAGGALGAALYHWHQVQDQPRALQNGGDAMSGAYLGPAYDDDEITAWLDAQKLPYRRLPDGDLECEVARLIDEQNVVGMFQGRMEFGPRALGNRSILGDARSPKMQSVLNLKIKYRESFRPFAPSCLEERIGDFFDIDRPSPYMLLVAQVRPERCLRPEAGERGIHEMVNQVRSDVPAITHVDHSARIQSVSRETNPRYHRIIKEFEKRTGFGIIINTSFNVRGEPIVCTPEDAYRCFRRTEMDYLVLGNQILDKSDQPQWAERGEAWQEEFPLD